MNCKQVDIDTSIHNLIETFQDHFGELHYALFVPEERYEITSPTIADVRQIILDSSVLPVTDRSKLIGKVVQVDEFLGNYLEQYESQKANKHSSFIVSGYEYAFLNPPYGLNLDFTETSVLRQSNVGYETNSSQLHW